MVKIEIKKVSGDAKKKLEQIIKQAENKVGKVGWFENSRYQTKEFTDNITNAQRKNIIQTLEGLGGNIPAQELYNIAIKKLKNREDKNPYVASVAATQELGDPAKRIPPRPFMRPTIEAKKQEWLSLAANRTKKIIDGKKTLIDVLDELGQKAAGDIRKTIKEVVSPPLSPITIAIRLIQKSNKKEIGKLTKPLVDTGIMLVTLTNTVEEE